MWGGVLITIFYVLLVSYLVQSQNVEMPRKLNEIGDFLAGIFGPITIVWLILGFIQQGMELRQNNEALKMQASELKASVEQQAAMAESQRVTLDNHGKTMEPLLKLSSGSVEFIEGERYLNLTLANQGEYCEGIRIDYPELEFTWDVDCLFEGDSCGLTLNIEDFREAEVNVRYVNRLGIEGLQGFKISKYFFDDGEGYFVNKKPFLSKVASQS